MSLERHEVSTESGSDRVIVRLSSP